MKKNLLIFSLVLVVILVLSLLFRFIISPPSNDFAVTADNYSGDASSEITITNGGNTIATIPALKNEETKEIKKSPVDLTSGGLTFSYTDMLGKKHEENLQIDGESSTMNSTVYISILKVKKDGILELDISYTSGTMESSLNTQE
ncbi:hypothetical protein HB943_12160 [Listeria weihenstephanensis]|uniref:Uncharacterized protein n=1 Tax=Listeria weihenstephanensis TaxID=1006155 RepID=A0A841ZA52_9LIST|nr:hypothetical protein [Listeria weihenstephanensis]MBC1501357.1 hypothetical protein [Listeria weihenstephanensis]